MRKHASILHLAPAVRAKVALSCCSAGTLQIFPDVTDRLIDSTIRSECQGNERSFLDRLLQKRFKRSTVAVME